jgi:hypothetical protein
MAETGCGRLDYPSFRRKIPRAAAVSQVALWSKAGSVWIKADDETHQIIGTLDKIRDALEPIIPASLGWEVITPVENNDGFLVSALAEPVIGWRDCEHGPMPITAMQSENNVLWAIKTPDGKVFDLVANARFASGDEWLAAAKIRWNEIKAAG